MPLVRAKEVGPARLWVDGLVPTAQPRVRHLKVDHLADRVQPLKRFANVDGAVEAEVCVGEVQLDQVIKDLDDLLHLLRLARSPRVAIPIERLQLVGRHGEETLVCIHYNLQHLRVLGHLLRVLLDGGPLFGLVRLRLRVVHAVLVEALWVRKIQLLEVLLRVVGKQRDRSVRVAFFLDRVGVVATHAGFARASLHAGGGVAECSVVHLQVGLIELERRKVDHPPALLDKLAE
mmetsp:Transcript_10461/g.23945  ORF Transcript_10461/g.23945 Transcript_10461/m.23945 type:complete len:233 (+) Transcript_10461:1081-1779(+)